MLCSHHVLKKLHIVHSARDELNAGRNECSMPYLCSSDRAALWFSPRLSFSLPKDVAGSHISDGIDVVLCASAAVSSKSDSCTPLSRPRGLHPDLGDLVPTSLRLQHTVCAVHITHA